MAKEENSRKRRATDTKTHISKRIKEPRPHPSYRLNKRYWDDVRAGRRSTCNSVPNRRCSVASQLTVVPNLQKPVNISQAMLQQSLPCLSPYPIMKQTYSFPTKYLPYPFYMSSPSTSSCQTFISNVSLPYHRQVIHDATYTSSKDVNSQNLIHAEVTTNMSKNSDDATMRASDSDVDIMVDRMMMSLAVQKPQKNHWVHDKLNLKKTLSKTSPFFLFPVPIPTPIFIPLTESFVMKHFTK